MGTQLRNLIVSLMLLIGSVTAVCAQTILVQGKVLDSRGTPLPKVSVTVKLDNSTHTTTDKAATSPPGSSAAASLPASGSTPRRCGCLTNR